VTAALLAGAVALQLLTLELVHLRHTNPDLLRRDEDAYRALAQLDRVSPGYGDSAALLRDLRARLVRHRYQDGMRLFREELLEDAIEQWRGVLALDPMHVEARRNIDQAEKMLRFLAAQQKRPAQPSAEYGLRLQIREH
jgi:hypothetical protein